MTNKRYHILKKNHANVRPVEHLFVDVESRLVAQDDCTTVHKLWFGWTCYWRRRPDGEPDQVIYERFKTVAAFWDIVIKRCQRKRPLNLVAHNVNYDFGVLNIFDELTARDFELQHIYLAGMTAILSFVHDSYKILVLDNANWYKSPLADIGQALGYPKLDVDPLTATEAEADPYCKRDTEILLKGWQTFYSFIDKHDLGKWGHTLPSQAFNAYRHRFMDYPIHIHADKPALELERAAYHGGRTSIFYKGHLNTDQYYYLDVNSMYPYVMAQYDAPRQMHSIKEHVSLTLLREYLKSYQCIAQVDIDTDEPCYPVKNKGHIVYPVGQFTTTLCTPELEYALEHKHILAIERVVRYNSAPLFKSYVNFFYNLKREYKNDENAPFYLMVKLFLNSLYGKFGQRSIQMEKVEIDDPDIARCCRIVDHSTEKSIRLYRFGDQLWQQVDKGESYNSAPAIAAHVCAFARMYLWSIIKKAGREHVYYCDTDSLIVDRVGFDNLLGYLDDSALGSLKVEQTANNVTLYAPKCYQFGDTIKRKGVPKKALQIADNAWEYDQFPSFRQQSRWQPGTPFHTTRTQRTLTYRLYDGTVDKKGWVTPFSAYDLEIPIVIPPEDLQKVAQLRITKETMSQTLKVDAKTIFSIWDHKKGNWRQARDSQGNIVPLEYSQWDSKATELGFDDLRALKDETLQTISTWEEIRAIDREIYAKLHPAPDTSSTTPMPW